MKAIFQKILENTCLLDKHRDQLRNKRGFTDNVIDSMQFKSCNPDYQYKEWYKTLPPNFQQALSVENILIPYLNLDDVPYHIRPHKFGIKNLEIQVYIPYKYIGNNTKRIVLAESEFKALASCIMGAPSIGLPGIASFSGKKFNNLVELLTKIETSEVIICFDREEKGDKHFENYKKDFRSRYDTEFYSYVMAEKLMKRNIKARIAILNRTWMRNGKVDIDSILASNIAHDMYLQCIENAVDPDTYRNMIDIPVNHKSFLERRFDKYFYNGPIRENGKSYVYAKPSKGKEGEFILSNFIIKVHHTVYDADGKAERLCKFYSKYGNTSTALLSPDVMVSKSVFQKFCYERGDLEFYGTDAQLQDLWKWVFMNQDGIGIRKLTTWGYNDELDAWFFANGAYKNDDFFSVDEDGIVWIDDEGYKLPEYNSDNFTPPALSDSPPTSGIDIQNIFNKLKNIMDEQYARLLLGWTFGNFFIADILKEYKVYPFLFMYGKMSSGKSTYANIAASFFGFKINGVAFSSTPVGIMTAAQQLCGPPIWIEEFRNSDQKIAEKINMLRSIYDRSTRIKASRKAGEVKAASARSTIIISGEEYPRDAAFNSRCIQIPVYRDIVKGENNEPFKWIMEFKSTFNEIGHYILMNKNVLWEKISDRIKTYHVSFEANDITLSDRNKIHYSIIGSVADVLIGEDENFSINLAEKAVFHDVRVLEEQALYVFFADLQNMSISNKLNCKILQRKEGAHEDRLVNFAFSIAYAEWEHYYRGMRNDIPASKAALSEHLKREKYFKDFKQARIAKKSTYCAILDVKHKDFPDSLKNILENQTDDFSAPLGGDDE